LGAPYGEGAIFGRAKKKDWAAATQEGIMGNVFEGAAFVALERYLEIHRLVYLAVHERITRGAYLSFAAVNRLAELTEMNIALEALASNETDWQRLGRLVSSEWNNVLREHGVDGADDSASEFDCEQAAMELLIAVDDAESGAIVEFLAHWFGTNL
jgi:hypothetical protein